LKNAFAIVTLSALLSACAIAPQAPEAAPKAPEATPTPAAEAAAAGLSLEPPAPVPDPLPNVDLTGELLYRITKAELEFKRGQWQGPYVTMLSLAQQTRDPRLAKRAAEMALAAKQGGEALAAIRLWRGLAPDSDEAAQFLLGFAVVADDLSEAEQIFAQRLASSPPGSRGLYMLQMQQFLLRAKNKAAAFALQERVLAKYDDTLESHLILAQGAFALGDSERARGEAERALAIKPDSELAILTKAQVAPDVDSANKLMTDFLAVHPKAREVRAAYARVLAESKQYDTASKQFQILLQDQPNHLPTLYALGMIALQANDPKGAEGYFKRFMAAADHPGEDADPTKVLLILAQIAEDRNDLDVAIQWLDKIDSNADSRLYLSSRLKRAALTARKGDVDDARRQLADLHPSDPAEQAQVFQADAQLLRDAGDNIAAFTVLENALKRYPDNTDLLYDYALMAEKLGQVDVMEAALRRVIAAAPDNQHAYNALGYSLAERNVRLTEAYNLIATALKLAPGDPFIMDSMGWVQFRMGNLDQAEDLLRRAYAQRSDPEIAVHLGEVLWTKGDKAGAEKLWQEARSKDPQNDVLRSTLARLNPSL
jgi:Tfp pilus assembly protein PilF